MTAGVLSLIDPDTKNRVESPLVLVSVQLYRENPVSRIG